MSVIQLHHKEILHGGAMAQVSRVLLSNKRPKALHAHDFYELVWVQNGTVIHHTKADKTTLSEGALLFVQPHHAHALQGKGQAAMVVSMTLHPDLIDRLGRDHAALSGHGFWAATDRPVVRHKDSLQLAALNRAALAFEQAAPDLLHTTAFLLPLCTDLVDVSNLPAAAPDWLRRACLATLQPAVFRDGAAGLVAQTGKAHAHVTRTLKQHTGETPASYVNAIRMRHAARALVGSADPLSEIATEIGIPNLSHFHKQFRSFHGQSPAQFRMARQRHVAQPE